MLLWRYVVAGVFRCARNDSVLCNAHSTRKVEKTSQTLSPSMRHISSFCRPDNKLYNILESGPEDGGEQLTATAVLVYSSDIVGVLPRLCTLLLRRGCARKK